MAKKQHEGTLTCSTHGLLLEGVLIPPGMDYAEVGMCATIAGLHATQFPDCVLTFNEEPIGSAQARADEARRIEAAQIQEFARREAEAIKQRRLRDG